MAVSSEGFVETLGMDIAQAGFHIGIFSVRFHFHLDVVDEELLVPVAHRIAGNADDALDVVHRRVLGIAEYHDLAALRILVVQYFDVDDREPYPISIFVHKDEIANEKGGDHRTGGNLEGFHQERAKAENDEDDRKKASRVFHPPRALDPSSPAWLQNKFVQQHDRPGSEQQDE